VSQFHKNRHNQYYFSSLRYWKNYLSILIFISFLWASSVIATPLSTNEITEIKQNIRQEIQVIVDTIWVIFSGCLVFFMNAGFAMLEAGFCRSKNTVNILAKNLIVFALVTLAFWSIGFGIMFGFGGNWDTPTAIDNGFIGLHGFFLEGIDNSPATREAYQGVYRSLNLAGIPVQAKFFFQLVFAGVAVTIVSGAVAERIKFFAFVLFSLFLGGIGYPITGHWIWGGGWLYRIGFWDFAGSTVVHSVGGWAALIGALMLGPRLGKYQDDDSLALPGHSFPLATLGCLILWLGWFGFNAGSTLAADPQAIAHLLLTTNMAGAMGGISAAVVAWRYFGKPDLSVIINGILGGCVGITASCRFVNIGSAALIGIIAGILVIIAVDILDRLRIDDPVGAIAVHLVCGIWGTAAVGLFSVGPQLKGSFNFVPYLQGPSQGLLVGGGLGGLNQLLLQLLGIAAVGLFSILINWLAWFLIQLLFGLRVSKEAELKGLDLSEHGMQAYSGFLMKNNTHQDLF
jgi:ammonium transporter, Amt family